MKLNVTVIINAKNSGIIKIDESNYKVKIDEPAVDNRANKRLIELLTDYFKVQKSSVKILKGLKNRNKIVSIDNL